MLGFGAYNWLEYIGLAILPSKPLVDSEKSVACIYVH